MRSSRIEVVVSVVVGVGLGGGACGRDVKESEPPRVGPPAPWESMGFEARKAYMTEAVLPRMREVFQAYDPKYFAEVTCETCHGIDAEEGRYAMPNEDLFALYPTGHEQQIALVKRQPDILRFMFNKVVPEVQALLGAPAWDAATQTGFSCFSCHPRGQ